MTSRTKDEQLLKLLECPVCMETCSRPILSCQKGHSICNICKPRVEVCPICREVYVGTRNFIAEDLATNLPTLLKTPGTTKIASGKIKCSLATQDGCKFGSEIFPSAYIQHLINKHKIFVVRRPMKKFLKNNYVTRNAKEGKLIHNGSSKMFTMIAFGQNFLITNHQVGTKIWIWVATDANALLASEFRAELVIENKITGHNHTQNVAVNRISLGPEEILKLASCIVMNESDFCNYLQKASTGVGTLWTLHVTISRSPQAPARNLAISTPPSNTAATGTPNNNSQLPAVAHRSLSVNSNANGASSATSNSTDLLNPSLREEVYETMFSLRERESVADNIVRSGQPLSPFPPFVTRHRKRKCYIL